MLCHQTFAVEYVHGNRYAITIKRWISIPKKASLFSFLLETPITGSHINQVTLCYTTVASILSAVESRHGFNMQGEQLEHQVKVLVENAI